MNIYSIDTQWLKSKSSFKLAQFLLIALTAFLLPANSQAKPVDSTKRAPSATEKFNALPAATYGSPFLLDRGLASTSVATRSNPSGAPPEGNYYYAGSWKTGTWTDGCQVCTWCGITNPTPRCAGWVYTHPLQCPTGFSPHATATPVTSSTPLGTPAYACAFKPRIDSAYPDRYLVRVDTGATPKFGYGGGGGGVGWVPGVSFQWEIYCYPDNVTQPPVEASYCSSPSAYDSPIITWDSGYAATVNDDFIYSRRCPPAYTPYVVAESAGVPAFIGHKVDVQVSNDLCITGLEAYGSNQYRIRIKGKRVVLPIHISTSTLSFEEPYTDNARLRLRWTLYCYPPGKSPPVDYRYNPHSC